MKAFVTVTDTYGGEPNFGWVRKSLISFPENISDLALVRRAKKKMDWNGLKCRTENYGMNFTLTPHKICVVMFIDILEDEEADQ
jgi:hypothetical protein